MKNFNTGEKVAVFVGLGLIAYLFFSGPILNFFTTEANNQNREMIQTGVNTEDVVVGTGEVAAMGDVLTVHYVGELPSGRVFDSSRDRNTPINFTLGVGQVIRGWDEGVKGMRVGGKRILTIAPDYGYGANAVGAIPANSTLIFEVELLDVQKP